MIYFKDIRWKNLLSTGNQFTEVQLNKSSTTLIVGEFFIFPSSQDHQVYPFRTPDGKGERRSVSFNASFSSKSDQDTLRKQQEHQEAI